jgi:hypothetical protein
LHGEQDTPVRAIEFQGSSPVGTKIQLSQIIGDISYFVTIYWRIIVHKSRFNEIFAIYPYTPSPILCARLTSHLLCGASGITVPRASCIGLTQARPRATGQVSSQLNTAKGGRP